MQNAMSALPPKAPVCQDCAEVFLCPPGNRGLKNLWVHVRELSPARQAIVQLCPQVPRPFNNSWRWSWLADERRLALTLSQSCGKHSSAIQSACVMKLWCYLPP